MQSPLQLAVWKGKLKSHPDQDFAHYVTCSIEYGFHNGFSRPVQLPEICCLHQKNDYLYLQDELAKGNMLGPFLPTSAPNIHINRIGVIPMTHQVRKWHIITDFPSLKETVLMT